LHIVSIKYEGGYLNLSQRFLASLHGPLVIAFWYRAGTTENQRPK
jgi:hypothetical protein